MAQEGDIRTNASGQVETLTPEGIWSAEAFTGQINQLSTDVANVSNEIGVLTSQAAKDQTKDDLESLNAEIGGGAKKTYSGKQTIVTGPQGSFTVPIEDLQGWKDRGYTISSGEGQLSPEEMDALSTGKEDEEKTPEELDVESSKSDLNDINDSIDALTAKIDSAKTSYDSAINTYIDSIKSSYAARKQEAADLAERNIQIAKTLNVRLGTSRYSPITATGVISAEETQKIKTIAGLDSEMNSLIAQAQSAKAKEDWEYLRKTMDSLEKKRDSKETELAGLVKLVNEQNDKLEEQKASLIKTTSIIDLYNKGTTDPFEIYVAMNTGDTETVSLEEINDALESIPEDELTAFSDIEKKKLEQAGIDWTTTEGREKALNFLFKEDENLERTDAQVFKIMGETGKTEEEVKKMTDAEFSKYLYGKEGNKTLGGVFTDKDIARLNLSGVPEDIYTNVTKLLLGGKTREEIEPILNESGYDGKLMMDAYDRAVGIERIKTVANSDDFSIDQSSIDKLIEEE